MGGSEDIRHDRPTFDAIKGYCTCNCRVHAYLAGSSKLSRELPVLRSRPDRAMIHRQRSSLAWSSLTLCQRWRRAAVRGIREGLPLLWLNRQMQRVIEEGSVDNVPSTIVFGPLAGHIDVACWRIRVIPLHHSRQVTPPEFKVHAQYGLHAGGPASMALFLDFI